MTKALSVLVPIVVVLPHIVANPPFAECPTRLDSRAAATSDSSAALSNSVNGGVASAALTPMRPIALAALVLSRMSESANAATNERTADAAASPTAASVAAALARIVESLSE